MIYRWTKNQKKPKWPVLNVALIVMFAAMCYSMVKLYTTGYEKGFKDGNTHYNLTAKRR